MKAALDFDAWYLALMIGVDSHIGTEQGRDLCPKNPTRTPTSAPELAND